MISIREWKDNKDNKENVVTNVQSWGYEISGDFEDVLKELEKYRSKNHNQKYHCVVSLEWKHN